MDKPVWLARAFSVLLAGLAFSLTFNTDSVSSPAWLIINQGMFLVLVSQLLLPSANNLVCLLANSAAAMSVFIILSLLPVAAKIPALLIYRVCIVTFCLSLLLWSLRQLLEALCSSNIRMRNPVLLLTVITVAAPVWLGPFVEMYQPGDSAIDSIISITPLTHFAVAAEYDYLRSQWFYRNVAFGSLPFVYPGLTPIVTSYLVSSICLQIMFRWSKRYKLNLVKLQRRSLTIS